MREIQDAIIMLDMDMTQGAEGYHSETPDPPTEMLEALRHGDHKAFNYIYLHYSDSLLAFLSSLLRSREEAEEITQNVFIKIWEKRESIDPEKGIRRYLYRLAKHYAFDYFDHIKVKEKYADYISSATSDLSLDGAEETLLDKESVLLANIAIQRMPPKQREAFTLRIEKGLTYEEIAQQMNISKNTVRNHIATAIKELKKIMTLFMALYM